MRKFPVSSVLFVLAASSACRTPAAEPAAVSTPQPASLPAVSQPGLPGATGSVDADIVYDHRGAFGPLMLEQFEVMLDGGRARCLRLPVNKPSERATLELDADTVAHLRGGVDALAQGWPRDVRRQAVVQDLGVVTLSIDVDGERRSLVIDGAKSVDPYPDLLLRKLVELRGRCAYQPDPPPAHAPAAPVQQ